jgi:hypothetical protein
MAVGACTYLPGASEVVHEGDDEPRARGAQGVAQGDGPAQRVDLVRRQAQVADAVHGLARGGGGG